MSKHQILGLLLIAYASLAFGLDAHEFQKAMDASMQRMHQGMMVGYSGNPDADFARMMVAHHQGAIDMATIELTFGKDQQLRRLAQGIIVEQQQEIKVMQGVLASLSSTALIPTSPLKESRRTP